MEILVVVDMQNDFIDGALPAVGAMKALENVQRKIKDFDGHIVCTMDSHDEEYLSTPEGKRLPIPHCIFGQEGWKWPKSLEDALIAHGGFETVMKDTFGTFQLADTVAQYKCKIHKITMVGICTDICVVSNAIILKTAFPDIEICVDSSCCAGTSVEAHNAALMTMKMCQIDVI